MRKVSRIVAVVASAALAVTSSSFAEAGPLGGDGRELPYIDVTQIDFADLNNNYGVETVEPGNLVAFGDSIFSNPRVGDAVYAVASRKIPDETAANVVRNAAPHVSPRGCAQGTPSIPKALAANLNAPLNDYSCPGATVYSQGTSNSIVAQVEQAIQDGALNPETKFVAIQGGYNDIYNNYTVPSGVRPNDEQLATMLGTKTQKEQYAAAMDRILPLVKSAAPNAQVQLVGYHTITDDRPGGWQCLYHLGVGKGKDNLYDISYAFPIYWDTRGEVNTNNWMREAAGRNGVGYVDTRTFSANHGECAPPEDRWVGGVLIDNTTGGYNLALHLTDEGVHEVSRFVAGHYRT